MKNFVDEYVVDYRDPIVFTSTEKKVETQNFESDEEVSLKKSRNVFRKLLAIVLMCLSITGITYEVLKSKERPTLLETVSFCDNIRRYDDFIFPVVMQDPESFDQVQDADPVMLISASLWNRILSKRIDKFDNQGLGIIDMNEMWESYDLLFDSSFHPTFNEDVENNLFKFDSKNNVFYVKPCSNQTCYIPYTQECKRKDDVYSLKVGYVSPNDEWRTLKPNKPKTPTPVKVVEYNLCMNCEPGKMYIKSIKEDL